VNLFYLSELLQSLPDFQRLANRYKDGGKAGTVLRLPEAAHSFVAASIYGALRKPTLFITAHPEQSKRRFEQVSRWLSQGFSPLYFPEIDLLGTTPDAVLIADRIRALAALCSPANGTDCPPPFVLTSALSLAGKSVDKAEFSLRQVEVKTGQTLRQHELLDRLQSLGYSFEEVVEVPGTFTRRGGLVDVFITGRELPVRVEFSGDIVDSIREYDPRTQRSGAGIMSFTVLPGSDITGSGSSNILDYLPAEGILILDDETEVQAEIEKIEIEINGITAGENGTAQALKGSYLSWSEIAEKLHALGRILTFTERGSAPAGMDEIVLPIKASPNFVARFDSLVEGLPGLRKKNSRLVIVSQQSDRVKEMLQEHDIEVYSPGSLRQVPAAGSLTLLRGAVDCGWQITDELVLLTDLELFGIVKKRRDTKPRPVHHRFFLDDISVGDLVVHIEHGIGRFAGVTRRVTTGVEREYFMIEYLAGDVLYVPIDQVDRLSLYIGGTERPPRLSRLGSQEWNRSRQKVKESVANIAGELIELYAAREAGSGLAFSADTLWQQELEGSFPYVETPDQLEAIKAVKADMESTRPMDRLVCGDVGYGKTEVALRAAFKAVMDGRQVAMLVPTTILAQQHFNTFSERLKPFPVKIEVLSRFCTARQQADVIDGLKAGTVDICIGTHRLLQKDVEFKNLGLVIIDEEQRFGVVHKEHFKKMRQTIDVLTLSATPIPRTMHMALSGLRDMSTVETPPESRLPVSTYVGEFNHRMVREAILREIERDGQVFIVHNRVNSINDVAFKIAGLAPEARISIAHGQMDEEKLEGVMTDFIEGRSDILVTTTIIESGMDMPNVNTLVVDSADQLGLTQLYQLRGRVGRGANEAYAYFMVDSWRGITERAAERLKTIAHTTELGSGFAIAMKDLEIRGAGNLLGVEQSGNIAAVGFNYYCQLLAEAVKEIRTRRGVPAAKPATEPRQVSIDLPVPAFIPEYYIEDMRTRYNIYQRLAKATGVKAVREIGEELLDRFGQLPEEAANLLDIAEIRQFAIRSGAEAIYFKDDALTIAFGEEVPAAGVLSKVAGRKAFRVGNRQVRMDMEMAGKDWQEVLKNLLEDMAALSPAG